jgi:protein-S-isoprenylcysteine O-methyltransferase Ste14
VGFLTTLGIVYKKAVLEEKLLSSEKGFRQEYRDYALRTGRFLPKLKRTRLPQNGAGPVSS